MKPRVFNRGGWWRQIGPGLRMYAAPTVGLLSATASRPDEPPGCGADEG